MRETAFDNNPSSGRQVTRRELYEIPLDFENASSVSSARSVDSHLDADHYYENGQYLKFNRKTRNQSCCAYLCSLPDRLERFWDDLYERCKPKKHYKPRTIHLGRAPLKGERYPANGVSNQKYNVFSFIPLVLWEQFSVFINFIFLVMACSQFVPQLRVGYLYTYWGPLGFVLAITMIREAVDDIRRWRRDREVNLSAYTRISPNNGESIVTACKIKVGDFIWIDKDQRIPADMILLYSSERNGSCFIRTDQLDGETDWKLRHAIPQTQERIQRNPQHIMQALFDSQTQPEIYAEAPSQSIHTFVGTFRDSTSEFPLGLEHTLWANTVLASGSAVGLVVYTGSESRAVMNSSKPRYKFGRIDREVNNINKLLIACVVILAFIMVALKLFVGPWLTYYWRFFLLFSYIIPLALRVNMDVAKIVYAFLISRDQELQGCLVRNTTIPEELGRIAYLMSDKTGTLTQNEMVFKKLHLGNVSYAQDSMNEVSQQLEEHFGKTAGQSDEGSRQVKKTGSEKLVEAVVALALCHNVTPMSAAATGHESSADEEAERQLKDIQSDLDPGDPMGYQASSPDEIALVNWTASVGLTLVFRDQQRISLRLPSSRHIKTYEILQDFPFTSESKRMGIIVKDKDTGQIMLLVKGADTVMSQLVKHTAWLDDEVGNLAREGLRTLVVASKTLTEDQYKDFSNRLHQAKMSTVDRALKVESVVGSLFADLDTLCLTGVEDKLQDDVRLTLETMRNAGVRIWMLTGDKMETAECIAKSSRLVARGQSIHIFQNVTSRNDSHFELNAFRRQGGPSLIISGSSMEICLKYHEHEFIDLAMNSPAVVVCRCSPTQKASIVRLMRVHTGRIVAAIGDGGNDVGMIQAADVGLGLEGKEGKQASLASDFSLSQFKQVTRLLLVHGRNCYKNSAALSQFVMHRGIIISVMQAVFSAVYFFVAIQLFPGILMVGYATIFTMFPVFSLVLDRDVSSEIAMRFPELYKDMAKGRDLNLKTFSVWALISIYQGFVIMYGALFLFEDDFIHVVAITFTALVITELLMVALTVRTWHWIMILAELFSLVIYVIALVVLKNYFDPNFLQTGTFIWKTAAITAVSCIPLVILKIVRLWLRPTIYARLQ